MNWIGLTGVLWAPLVLLVLVALVPVLDRIPAITPARRKAILLAAGTILAALTLMSVWAGLSTPVAHVGM